MGQKKNLKYYLMIFGIAVLAILIYTVINWISSGVFDPAMLLSGLILPILFTIFLFVFDKIFDKLFPKQRKLKEKKEDFSGFVNEANKALEREGEFSIADYRTLQDSERFQKTLRQLFTIKNQGETEDLTIDYLSKKFKKTTIEYTAVQIIIGEVKKLD